jgi:hypothetical protein
MKRRIFLFVGLVALLAGCGGGLFSPEAPAVHATCGPPPPTSAPQLSLVYPAPGATNVPTDVGLVVFEGNSSSLQIAMRSSSGAAVALGAPTAAPSPLPTPHAEPTGIIGGAYFAESVPALSPATTYTLSYTYSAYNGIPPACAGPQTQSLGSFTTQ